jgi:hypothetical protein
VLGFGRQHRSTARKLAAQVVSSWANGACTNPANAAPGMLVYGGSFGAASRCFAVNGSLGASSGRWWNSGHVDALCARSSCDAAGTLRLTLVFEDGSGQTLPCPAGGSDRGAALGGDGGDVPVCLLPGCLAQEERLAARSCLAPASWPRARRTRPVPRLALLQAPSSTLPRLSRCAPWQGSSPAPRTRRQRQRPATPSVAASAAAATAASALR